MLIRKLEKNLTVTPAKYKETYPFLKEVDSLALANAQMNLQSAYNNFFRDKSVGSPKFKSKKIIINHIPLIIKKVLCLSLASILNYQR